MSPTLFDQLSHPLQVLEGLFSNAPVPYAVFDRDGRCVLTNPAYREMFGTAPPPEYSLLEDALAAKLGLLPLVRRAYAGETVNSDVFWYDPKELPGLNVTDAKRVAIGCTLFPLSEPGRPSELVAIAYRDLTAQLSALDLAENQGRSMDAERTRLHRLLSEAPACVALLEGPDHLYVLSNPLNTRLSRGRIQVGKTVREVLPEFEAQGILKLLDHVYTTGEPLSFDEHPVDLEEEGGQTRRVYMSGVYQATRDASGKITGIANFAYDVTELVRSRMAVEESEARYRAIFEGAGVSIWEEDFTAVEAELELLRNAGVADVGTHLRAHPELVERLIGLVRFIDLNRASLELLEAASKEELLGSLELVFEAENREAFSEAIVALAEDRRTVSREMPVRTVRGARKDVFVTVTFPPRPQRVDRVIVTATDVTARKRAEDRAALLANASKMLSESLEPAVTLEHVANLAVPAIADGCALDVLEPDGTIRNLLVRHRDPARMQQFKAYVDAYPPDLKATWGVGKVLRTGLSDCHPEVDVARIIDTEVPAARRADMEALMTRSYVCIPITNRGKVFGALRLLQTDSGRRFVESDLETLEDLGRRIGNSLDNARLYAEAQEAIRLRDEFLGIASHELRTPIAALSLHFDLLTRSLPERLRAEIHSRLALTRKQIGRLGNLVEGLLDVSRISAGKLQLSLESVDFSELLRDVASRFAPEFDRAGSSLEIVARSATVGFWDRIRLEQVVSNLLSNAVKYGAGTPVRASLETTAEGRVRFVVEDGGIGIASDALPRLFQRFERAVSGRHYGGLGLGLYLTRQIVEAMEGTIRVQSTLGKGSSFVVELPREVRVADEEPALTKAS